MIFLGIKHQLIGQIVRFEGVDGVQYIVPLKNLLWAEIGNGKAFMKRVGEDPVEIKKTGEE